jgi:hypothetical protein
MLIYLSRQDWWQLSSARSRLNGVVNEFGILVKFWLMHALCPI